MHHGQIQMIASSPLHATPLVWRAKRVAVVADRVFTIDAISNTREGRAP